MNVKIKNNEKTKIFQVEMDASRFERMAANFGFFSDDFLKSLDRAEKDYQTGKSRKIKSLSSIK